MKAEKEASMRPAAEAKNLVDDQGTTQNEALELLRTLWDRGFDSNTEKLAVALGRTIEQIETWLAGSGTIDDDVVMKIRGIAKERKIDIEGE